MSNHRISLNTLAAALILVATVPAAAIAQNCLGFRLAGGQHAVGSVIDERGEFGGVGGWYAGLLKNGVSLHAEVTKHDVEMGSGSGDYEKMTLGTARVSIPVLRKQSVNDNPDGLCAFAEYGFSSFQGSSANNYGIGIGYAINRKWASLFAGPVLGQASAGGVSDSYINVIASATARWRFLMFGIQTTQPIQPEGATGYMDVRFGYAFGHATPITKSWTH